MFKLYVKNMVCDRCKLVVRQVLEKVGMDYTAVELGEVVLPSKPLIKLLHQFQKGIEDFGFELIEDKVELLAFMHRKEIYRFFP